MFCTDIRTECSTTTVEFLAFASLWHEFEGRNTLIFKFIGPACDLFHSHWVITSVPPGFIGLIQLAFSQIFSLFLPQFSRHNLWRFRRQVLRAFDPRAVLLNGHAFWDGAWVLVVLFAPFPLSPPLFHDSFRPSC